MSRPAPTRRLLLLVLLPAQVLLAIAPATALAGRTRCGPNDCAEGSACCNYGCGICVSEEHGGCIELFCNWGRPEWIDPPHWPGADVFDGLVLGTAFASQRLEVAGQPESSVAGVALQGHVQHYVAEQTAVRLALAATQLIDDEAAPGGATFGWSAGGGVSYRLPDIGTVIGWAVVADGEYRGGPELSPGLGPALLTEGGIASVAVGIGFADLVQAGPITAQVRYVHAFLVNDAADGAGTATATGEAVEDLGLIDVAVGVSTDLRWIHAIGGPEVPVGLRVGYRFSAELSGGDYLSHELGGGVYGLVGDELRVGADVVADLAQLTGDVDTTRVNAVVLVDWFWDSNY